MVKNGLVNSEIKYFLKKAADDVEYKQDNPSEKARENSFHVFQTDSSDMTPGEFGEMLQDLCESAVSSCESLLNALDAVVKILNSNGLDLYCGPTAFSKSGGILCTTETVNYETPLVIAIKSDEEDLCIRYTVMENGSHDFDIMTFDFGSFVEALQKIAYIFGVVLEKIDNDDSCQYDPIEVTSILAAIVNAKNEINAFIS